MYLNAASALFFLFFLQKACLEICISLKLVQNIWVKTQHWLVERGKRERNIKLFYWVNSSVSNSDQRPPSSSSLTCLNTYRVSSAGSCDSVPSAWQQLTRKNNWSNGLEVMTCLQMNWVWLALSNILSNSIGRRSVKRRSFCLQSPGENILRVSRTSSDPSPGSFKCLENSPKLLPHFARLEYSRQTSALRRELLKSLSVGLSQFHQSG